MRKRNQRHGRDAPRAGGSGGAHPAPGPRWLVPAVAACAILVSLSSILFGVVVNDEGVTAMGGWRVAQGQLPYRDFFSVITPFSFYYTALAFKLGGVSILSERIAGAVLGVLLVLLTARLSRAYIASPLFAALPVAILCASGVSLWPFPSHHWLASVLVLGALVCAERALASGPFGWSAAAGALGGLAVWSLQDQGGYLWVGAAVLFLPWLGRERARKTAAGWIAGGALASLPFLLLLWKVPASTLAYDLVGYGLTAYREANVGGWTDSIKEMVSGWTTGEWSQAPFAMGNVLATQLVTILVPHLALPLVLWGWWRRWDSGPKCALLAMGCVSFVGAVFHRWAGLNLQWGQAVPAVAVAWALSVWHAREAGRKRRLIPAALALVVMVSFLAYGAQRVWAALDATRTIRVTALAGSLYTNNPFEARFVQETLDQIERRIPPGAPFLTSGLPFFNFWTLRPSPVPYDWFMPPALTTPAQTDEVLRVLEARKLEWVVTTREFETKDQPFTKYLKSRYTRTWANPACGLWHRNPEPPDAP